MQYRYVDEFIKKMKERDQQARFSSVYSANGNLIKTPKGGLSHIGSEITDPGAGPNNNDNIITYGMLKKGGSNLRFKAR